MKDSVSATRPADIGFSEDSAVAVQTGVLQQTVDVPIPANDSATKAIVYVWNDSMDGRTQVLLKAGKPNAVLSMHKNAVFAQTALNMRHGNLYLSNVKPLVCQIRIFDTRGRVFFAGEFRLQLGAVSIDLNGKNMSPGRYLLQLRNGMNEMVMPFMHVCR
jgi:hypothetical protein